MSISGKMKGVLVTVSKTRGSTPREAGAWMWVGQHAVTGTIGGGQLEYMAIDAARAGRLGVLHIPLGPEIGQCCGGHVTLTLTSGARPDPAPQPDLLIFGAGHTGRALARMALHLPVNVTLIDSRPDELAKSEVPTCLSALPEAEVARARPGSSYVIVTHDHALDFLIAAAALQRVDATYVGMIGSATKRTRFEIWCRAHAPAVDPRRLICPIGQGAPDKRPAVIAAFTATEILSVRAASKVPA